MIASFAAVGDESESLNSFKSWLKRAIARDAAPQYLEWRLRLESEWPHGEAAQGGHPRQEGGEGTRRNARCRSLGSSPMLTGSAHETGCGGGEPDRQRPHEPLLNGERGARARAARTPSLWRSTRARSRVMARSNSHVGALPARAAYHSAAAQTRTVDRAGFAEAMGNYSHISNYMARSRIPSESSQPQHASVW